MTTLHLQAKLPRLTLSKLVERFGLFTIIVLGEAIVGVASGLAEIEELSLGTGIEAVFGLGLAFGLWWIYFDFVARRESRPGVWWFFTWGNLHLPLVMGIAALGAGGLNLLTLEGATVPDDIRLLVSGALSVVLITIGLIEITLKTAVHEPTNLRISAPLKIAAGIVALILGLVGSGLSAIALFAILLALVLAQMVYGGFVWFHRTVPALGEGGADYHG